MNKNTNYHELTENTKTHIYRLQGEFDEFISGKGKSDRKVEAVIYDQYRCSDHVVRYVNGSQKEILESYGFYKDAYPDRCLGLACKEYYEQLIRK